MTQIEKADYTRAIIALATIGVDHELDTYMLPHIVLRIGRPTR